MALENSPAFYLFFSFPRLRFPFSMTNIASVTVKVKVEKTFFVLCGKPLFCRFLRNTPTRGGTFLKALFSFIFQFSPTSPLKIPVSPPLPFRHTFLPES